MATKTIELQEAQQHLLELVAQVAAGTEIILTDVQTPRARLVPLANPSKRRIAGLWMFAFRRESPRASALG